MPDEIYPFYLPPISVEQGKETEHNWAAREKAILRVRGMLKGEVHERYPETFVQGLKNGFIDASLKTVSIVIDAIAPLRRLIVFFV